MKKLMIGLVGALAMVASAEVESENIVGYTQQDVAAGKFAMIGVQFTDVTGGTTLSIQDLIKGVEGVEYGDGSEFLQTAPQIQVWSGSGYTYYYYLTDAYDLVADDGSTFEGWADIGGNYTTVTFKPGEAVWFKAAADCTITTSGQIFQTGVTSVTCPSAKFTMVANTKPVPLNLNDNTQLSYSNLIGVEYGDGSEFLKTAPQIQVWGGVGYTYYYYLTDAYDLVADDGSTFEGWADIGGNYVNTAIETGRGFWVKAVTGEFTINFAK